MPVCCQLPNLRESHNFQDAWSNTTRRARYLRFIFSRAKRLIVVIARDDHWSLLPIFAAFDRGRQPKADPNLYLENCRDLWDESQSFRGLQGSNNWIQDTLKLVALWNEDACIQLHTQTSLIFPLPLHSTYGLTITISYTPAHPVRGLQTLGRFSRPTISTELKNILLKVHRKKVLWHLAWESVWKCHEMQSKLLEGQQVVR